MIGSANVLFYHRHLADAITELQTSRNRNLLPVHLLETLSVEMEVQKIKIKNKRKINNANKSQVGWGKNIPLEVQMEQPNMVWYNIQRYITRQTHDILQKLTGCQNQFVAHPNCSHPDSIQW